MRERVGFQWQDGKLPITTVFVKVVVNLAYVSVYTFQDRFTLRICKIYVSVVLHFFGVMYKLEKKNYQLPRQSVNGKINDLAITGHYFYGNRGHPGKDR